MNAEQKQRAMQMLRRFSQANPRTLQADNAAVDMSALLHELSDAPEPEPALVVKVEPDYCHRGHYCEGSKPYINPLEVWKLPVGTKLYTAPPAPSVLDGWMRAIDEALVVHHIDIADSSDGYEEAKKKLNELLAINSDIARDCSEPPADVARDAELWAPIADFNGVYEVSTIGRIRSVTRIDSDNNRRLAKYLTPTAIRKGYLKVCLWNGGERIERYVHRLVASAFIENPGHLPQVNHKDGDPANNEVSNLEWVTNAQNQTHARRILAKGVRAVYGISLTDGSRIDFASLELAVEAGFVRANIQKCISGTRKKHKGYAWYDAAIERDKQKGGAK